MALVADWHKPKTLLEHNFTIRFVAMEQRVLDTYGYMGSYQ
jgi:hypothetical protein